MRLISAIIGGTYLASVPTILVWIAWNGLQPMIILEYLGAYVIAFAAAWGIVFWFNYYVFAQLINE